MLGILIIHRWFSFVILLSVFAICDSLVSSVPDIYLADDGASIHEGENLFNKACVFERHVKLFEELSQMLGTDPLSKLPKI